MFQPSEESSFSVGVKRSVGERTTYFLFAQIYDDDDDDDAEM